MKEEDIYLLITQYLLKETSTEENAFLADWITSSAENERTFEAIKICWLLEDQQSSFNQSVESADKGASIAALSQLNALIDEQEHSNAKSKRMRFYRWTSLAASILLLGAIVAITFKSQQLSSTSSNYVLQLCKAGEIKTFLLNDGTKVTLGPGSSFKYPAEFTEQQREVDLIGEAYFEVTKNLHRPFKVHTRNLEVKVLGTHFNVDAAKNRSTTTVSLFEGKVNVNLIDDHNEAYQLKPGQELVLDHANQQIYQHALDSVNVLGWMTRTLIFSNEKLSDAARKIEKMYGVRLVFDNASTAEVRIYARFNNESLNEVLQTICLTGDLTYHSDGNKVYLSNNK